jgi:hypothetical protein
LDPRASARIETDAYAQGALVLDNVTPIHLGGVRRRGGLRYRAQLPNKLSRVIAVPTITAPEGGTANNANDYDQTTLLATTNNVGTTDPYVVVRYDLGVATSILFADVLDLFSTGGSSTEFAVQYSTDDVAWTVFETMFPLVDTTPRGYRRGGTAVSARYWRVVKFGGTDMGTVTISISSFNLWQSTATVSEVRFLPFEISTEDRYLVALTDLSATIFQNGAYVRSVPSPYVSDDLVGIDATTNAETMVIVHEDYAPRFLLREVNSNFQMEVIDFDEVPTFDFADASSPTPTSDVQVITFAAGWAQGDTFQIELDGARSGVVVFAGDATADAQAATAANIAREVQKLFTVNGFDGVTCARTSALTYTVTFADASADNYQLMNVVGLSATGSAVATVAKTANGVPRSEPVWSATRGYPRTAAFFEARLYFGGTRSLQQAILASQVNNILFFEIGEGLPDDPIFRTLNGAKLNAIQGLYAGRSLQLFTSGEEMRFAKAQGTPITPGDAPAIQTSNGASKIRPVSIDGATLFVQRTGKAIRDFRFDFEEDSYNSLGVSSLAPHLINGALDLAAWNGSSVDEISLVFVVNADGTIAVFNSRKEANVQAWTRWTTQGSFKAVGVVLEDIYFAVLRSINSVSTLFLEQIDDDFYTDCSVRKTGADSFSVTGLDHLNGEESRVRADEFVLDNQTPVAGAITIERESSDVEVGLNFNTEVTPMPLNAMTPTGPNFLRKRRIVKARVKVRNTLGLICNDRELGDRAFDINFFDEFGGTFTGTHSIEDTTNWDEAEEKLVTFRQVDPLPMEILGFEVQMESND